LTLPNFGFALTKNIQKKFDYLYLTIICPYNIITSSMEKEFKYSVNLVLVKLKNALAKKM